MQLFSPLADAGHWLSSAFKCLHVCVEGEVGDVVGSLSGCAGGVKSSLEQTFNEEDGEAQSTGETPDSGALQPEGQGEGAASGAGSDIDCVLEDVSQRYANIELCAEDMCPWVPRMLVHRDFTDSMTKLDEAAAACSTRVLVTASFRGSAAGVNAQRAAGFGVHVNIYKSDNTLCNSECLMMPGEKEQAVACLLDKMEQEPLLRWRGDEGAAVVDGGLDRETLSQATRDAQVAASTACYDHTLQAVSQLVDAEVGEASDNELPEPDNASDREDCTELEEGARQPGALRDQSTTVRGRGTAGWAPSQGSRRSFAATPRRAQPARSPSSGSSWWTATRSPTRPSWRASRTRAQSPPRRTPMCHRPCTRTLSSCRAWTPPFPGPCNPEGSTAACLPFAALESTKAFTAAGG